jgi:acyl-CoA thioester hydrolase
MAGGCGGVGGMDVEEVDASRIDQVRGGEPRGGRRGGRPGRLGEPAERGGGVVGVERGDRELGERVSERKREGGSVRQMSSAARRLAGPTPGSCATTPTVVPHVYTARVGVRHHELDRFGRLHPAVYLRYLAEAAVEASAAAGFDAAWYAAAGTLWLVRRSTFRIAQPVRAGETIAIRTWVEDFRRVRSQRRYVVYGDDDVPRVDARTDWVYVDAASGRPRRVPAEMEAAFAPGVSQAREEMRVPAPPPGAARVSHRVRAHELDALGHVNNAAYLDLAGQAVLDALQETGWSVDRLLRHGVVPVLVEADLEYLDAARYGEALEIATWFTPADGALDAHQRIGRPAEARPVVSATTRWRWAEPASAAGVDPPDGLLAALRPLLAA